MGIVLLSRIRRIRISFRQNPLALEIYKKLVNRLENIVGDPL